MIGVLQGFVLGNTADTSVSIMSAEKSDERQMNAGSGESTDDEMLFFSMLVQMIAMQPPQLAQYATAAETSSNNGDAVPAVLSQNVEQAAAPPVSQSLDSPVTEMLFGSPEGTASAATPGNVSSTPVISGYSNRTFVQVGFPTSAKSTFTVADNQMESHSVEIAENMPTKPNPSIQPTPVSEVSPLAEGNSLMSRKSEESDGPSMCGGSVGASHLKLANFAAPQGRSSELIEWTIKGLPLGWRNIFSATRDRPLNQEADQTTTAEELRTLAEKFSIFGSLTREMPEGDIYAKISTQKSPDQFKSDTEKTDEALRIDPKEVTAAPKQGSSTQGTVKGVEISDRVPAVTLPTEDDEILTPAIELTDDLSLIGESKAAKKSVEATNGSDSKSSEEFSASHKFAEAKDSELPDPKTELSGKSILHETQQVVHHSKTEVRSPKPGEKVDSPIQLPQNFSKDLIVRISDELKAHIEGKASEVRVMMKPESMGQLSLRVTMEDGKLVAMMDVSNTTVRAALEAQLPQLREAMASQGIDVHRFDIVSSSTSQFERHADGNAFQRRQHARRQADVDVAEQSGTIKYLGYNTVEYII